MCIQLRNFMGAPAPGAPMLPTPVIIEFIYVLLKMMWLSQDSGHSFQTLFPLLEKGVRESGKICCNGILY